MAASDQGQPHGLRLMKFRQAAADGGKQRIEINMRNAVQEWRGVHDVMP